MVTRTAYIAIRWCVVESRLIKVVLVVTNNLRTVELAQDGEQRPSVPVICNSASIVAFTRQIRQRNILYILQKNVSKYDDMGSVGGVV